MIRINNTNYKIKKIKDQVDAEVRHLTVVVHGDLRVFENKRLDFAIRNNEAFKGVLLLPHYCETNDTTMFLVYVESIIN